MPMLMDRAMEFVLRIRPHEDPVSFSTGLVSKVRSTLHGKLNLSFALCPPSLY